MNNTIPTAEEAWNDFHFNYKGDENSLLEAMRHFARLHCKAQLKAILKNVSTKVEYSGIGEEVIVDKDSIINAYPLNQIK